MSLKQIAESRMFDGRQLRFAHRADTLNCDMRFSVFLPPQAEHGPVPVLYFLSGLTSTDENFMQKAGAQRAAAAHGIALIGPDTSPRGEGVPDDPDGAYDFGLGAGFYLNATQAPFATHYHMYDYCVDELPALVEARLPIDPGRQAITGHSMGGHGALTIAFKNPGRFRSVSAFAPICSPMHCPWGQKALRGYLGGDESIWREHDACALLEDGAPALPLRVDQGEADEFLAVQLNPGRLRAVCERRGIPIEFHARPGYDHGFFFVASFVDAHLDFHARYLS